MAISTEIVGKEFGPFVREYTVQGPGDLRAGLQRGLRREDGPRVREQGDAANPDLKVLPIFGAPLTVHEEMTRTLDYGYDYDGSLHYGFEIKLHAPFKMNDRIETFVTQDALYDRGEGRGCLSKQTGRSYSSDGTLLCETETWDVCIYDGGWGGPKPPKDIVEMPDRALDAVVEETMPLNMPLIYRLMGDWHQQHIDFAYTEQTGLARSHRPRRELGRLHDAPHHQLVLPGRAGAHEAVQDPHHLAGAAGHHAADPHRGRWATTRSASSWSMPTPTRPAPSRT
mgnify:CR=1 FL=1